MRFLVTRPFMRLLFLFALLALGLVSGCTWTSSNGSRHTIILGIGYVSHAEAKGISASDLSTLGITCENGISAGYARNHRVEIDPNTAPNAIVSVKARPFSLEVKNANPFSSPEGHPVISKEKENEK